MGNSGQVSSVGWWEGVRGLHRLVGGMGRKRVGGGFDTHKTSKRLGCEPVHGIMGSIYQ